MYYAQRQLYHQLYGCLAVPVAGKRGKPVANLQRSVQAVDSFGPAAPLASQVP